MKHTVVSLVILSLALVPAYARRFAEGPVKLTVWPAKAAESPDKIRLLPKAEDLTDADAVPLYEKAVQAMPRGIKQDQIREWLKLPPEQLPQQQVEEMVQKYLESLKFVFQATKCKQCNWPEWKPGMQILDLNRYRELAFVIKLWARLEICRGQYAGALAATQAGFGMASHLGQAPTTIQALAGASVGAMMCGEIEQFVQGKDSPNLYRALANLPNPLVNIETALAFEKQRGPALDRIRLVAKRLENNLGGLQCVEAIRHYAAAHEGQLPQTLSEIGDLEVPNDLMSGEPFAYRRTADGAELQSATPEGGGPGDTIHYEIVLRR